MRDSPKALDESGLALANRWAGEFLGYPARGELVIDQARAFVILYTVDQQRTTNPNGYFRL